MSAQAIQALISDTEALMRDVLSEAERTASSSFRADDLPLYDILRYHLGWVDESFTPVEGDSGKWVRPLICLLACGASGGDPRQAVPVGAGIELLHNFTLLHDDIQDRSELRRGRPTVWSVWGEAQAINVGDAAFALSQLALLRLEASDPIKSEVLSAFNRVTLKIVEGQVLDLGFEDRWDIGVDDYLRMISGKTASIVAFATWAGSRLSNSDVDESGLYRELGELLGLGFQVRDDYLGIWGEFDETGKVPGDDVRGRKRSIPIVMLLESGSSDDIARLRDVYSSDRIENDQVNEIIAMLDQHGVGEKVQALVTRYHDRALALLGEIAGPSCYRDELHGLAERLVRRSR